VAGAGWAGLLQQPRGAGYGLSHIPTHYADKSETERDMHSRDGAHSAIGMGHSS